MSIFPLFIIVFALPDLFCEKIPIESSLLNSILALFTTSESIATIPFALLDTPVILLPSITALDLST